ncbi:MAG: hypothetical protein KatS3mg068_0199 [Candidatus Sericytochromatia bacterium]|nr:MAG: hypothetical protein KatS3mg068_0199 [Candidatus Sericytochromatia bacterium]
MDIIKEFDIDFLFNLKSKTTGKYSVHDSYKDNFKDGLLPKDAPEDVNKALENIYYINDKGLVISYKEFNKKIAQYRDKIVNDKKLVDISKEEKIKIEREAAKNVLKDLDINENTKILYSPEISNFVKTLNNTNFKLEFFKDNNKLKVIKILSDDEIKSKLADEFINFSEFVNKLKYNSINSYNLDDIELNIEEITKKFEFLDDFIKQNEDFISLYNKTIEELSKLANQYKNKQKNLEEKLNNIVNKIIEKKDFNLVGITIKKIEEDLSKDIFFTKDTKSIAIKEKAIERLKTFTLVIALILLKDWNESNFKVADKILKDKVLTLDIENLLSKKYDKEKKKLEEIENSISNLDFNSYKDVYNKFINLSEKKELFCKLYDVLLEKNINILSSIIENLDNYQDFIYLLSRIISSDKLKLFWISLTTDAIEKINNNKLDYSLIKKLDNRDLYFEFVIEKGDKELLIDTFLNIKVSIINKINSNLLAKILLKIDNDAREIYLPDIISKLKANTILNIIDYDYGDNNYIKNELIKRLIKWINALDNNSNEFKLILEKYTIQAINNINPKKAKSIDLSIISQIIDNNSENKELLTTLVAKIGYELFDKATKYLVEKKALENLNNFESLFSLGITSLDKKDYEKAKDYFKQALGINPESAEAHFYLGFTYENIGQNDLALVEYKKTIQIKYDYVLAHFNLADLYIKLNEPLQAIQEYKKVIKFEPDNYSAFISLALAYEKINNLQEAKKNYEEAIKIDKERADAYINLANIYVLEKNTQSAIELYNEALKYDKDNKIIPFNLGILYHQIKDYNAAKAYYKLALKKDPNNSYIYNNLGLVYFSLTQIENAIKEWGKRH